METTCKHPACIWMWQLGNTTFSTCPDYRRGTIDWQPEEGESFDLGPDSLIGHFMIERESGSKTSHCSVYELNNRY
jgi:hypothetical protein